MAVNVEVKKNGNENTGGVIRRFTRRVQGSGVLPRMRSIRYYERGLSDYLKKKKALKRIKKTAEYERLIKLGRIEEKPRGRRR
ncbi:MAG: hypothetical protein WDZ90_00905 [Candidatus Paceibacterota bacterium]